MENRFHQQSIEKDRFLVIVYPHEYFYFFNLSLNYFEINAVYSVGYLLSHPHLFGTHLLMKFHHRQGDGKSKQR